MGKLLITLIPKLPPSLSPLQKELINQPHSPRTGVHVLPPEGQTLEMMFLAPKQCRKWLANPIWTSRGFSPIIRSAPKSSSRHFIFH